jgi:hypothetical protein
MLAGGSLFGSSTRAMACPDAQDDEFNITLDTRKVTSSNSKISNHCSAREKEVPTYNRSDLLRVALESIRALEEDDFRFEILVGDNGLTRETQDVAESYGAIYLPVQTSGASAARNGGLKVAREEFIAFLDDDDVWLKDHIRSQLSSAGMLGGAVLAHRAHG